MGDKRLLERNGVGLGFRLKMFAFAFFVGCIAAVAIDLDHPLSYALGVQDGRFLHLPILFICFVVWAYVGGLLVKMGVLENDRENN